MPLCSAGNLDIKVLVRQEVSNSNWLDMYLAVGFVPEFRSPSALALDTLLERSISSDIHNLTVPNPLLCSGSEDRLRDCPVGNSAIECRGNEGVGIWCPIPGRI